MLGIFGLGTVNAASSAFKVTAAAAADATFTASTGAAAFAAALGLTLAVPPQANNKETHTLRLNTRRIIRLQHKIVART